jgi:hypothetical protein
MFKPLLLMRIRSAHRILRAQNVNLDKLPASFMKTQTLLITSAIEKTIQARNAANPSRKGPKTRAGKVNERIIDYVPPTHFDPVTQATPSTDPDAVDTVRQLRDFRFIIESLQSEISSGIVNYPTSVPLKKLLESPFLTEYFTVSVFSKSCDSSLLASLRVNNKEYMPAISLDSLLSEIRLQRQPVQNSILLEKVLSNIHKVVSSRTSLAYNQIF